MRVLEPVSADTKVATTDRGPVIDTAQVPVPGHEMPEPLQPEKV